jgi:type I restriction enzyme S subunit
MNEGCTNQGFQSLIANNDTSYEFLYYLVSTLKNILIKNASGSTFLEISPNKIKQIEVKIPSIEEQTAIVVILSDMDAEIENLEQKRDKYTMLRQGMMQQLLTGRIRMHATN